MIGYYLSSVEGLTIQDLTEVCLRHHSSDGVHIEPEELENVLRLAAFQYIREDCTKCMPEQYIEDVVSHARSIMGLPESDSSSFTIEELMSRIDILFAGVAS